MSIQTQQQREALIMDHLPQVRLIARRIHDRLPENVSLEDLVSAGTIGLISAIDRFDPALGVKLKTYAEYKIRGAILDSLRTVDWAPRQQRRRARQIEGTLAGLEQRLQRAPTEDEVAAELGISVDEYRGWTNDIHCLAVGSLEATGNDEDGRELIDFIPSDEEMLPSNQLERAELGRLVSRALSRMPRVECTVITMYYQQEHTLREIAQHLNLHESRVSQLKTQAIARLRTFLATRWPERGAMASAKVA
jgi:RNA polymerase sigma factor for flagellar operon FliA